MISPSQMTATFVATSLNKINEGKQKTTEKLSSGYRINRAADDAAGLAISEKMRAQIRGLDRASKNSSDAISLVQVADGAMQEISDMLNRMRELAVQAANDVNTDDDREHIQLEVDAIKSEVDRIGKQTEFNTIKILQGKTLSDRMADNTLVDFSDTKDFDDNPPYLPSGLSGVTGSKTLDFAAITSSTKRLLSGTGFSFICPQGCGQTFDFVFVDSVPNPTNGNNYGILDETPKANITAGGTANNKKFQVGLDSFSNGTQLVSNIMNYVMEINGYTPEQSQNFRAHNVGHANYLYQDGSKLIVVGQNGNSNGKFTPIELANIRDKVPLDLWIQSGANSGSGMNITLPQIDAMELGIEHVTVTTHYAASQATDVIDSAVGYLNAERARLGAYQNRLEHTISNVDNASENLQAAESRIRDTDMANEMVEFSKQSILEQAGEAMLANSNRNAQSVLTLLQ